MNDRQLLAQFVQTRSQEAFGQLVNGHMNWVYSVCLRYLGDAHLAEDATQAVFLALATKAERLVNYPTISPWLQEAARFAAMNLLRTNQRQRRHVLEAAAMMPSSTPSDEPAWQDVQSRIEPAVQKLRFRDREAILLRFYEQKSHPQIAEVLGISEAAAKKRVARAVDSLRAILAPGESGLSSVGLTALLISNTVQTAPVSLANATTAALSTVASASHLAQLSNGVLHMMKNAKFQSLAASVTLAVSLLAGIGLVGHLIAAQNNVAPNRSRPTTVPAVTVVRADNPIEAIRLFCVAADQFNGAQLAEVMHARTPAQAQYVESLAKLLTSLSRFEATLVAQLPGDDVSTTLHARANVSMFTPQMLEGATATIEGDAAAVTLTRMPGPVPCIRIGGAWKIEIGGLLAAARFTDDSLASFNAQAAALAQAIDALNTSAKERRIASVEALEASLAQAVEQSRAAVSK